MDTTSNHPAAARKSRWEELQVNIPDSAAHWSSPVAGDGFARSRIWQQPNLWLATLDRISKTCAQLPLRPSFVQSRVLLTGAGTSAYAAAAIAFAWPKATTASASDILFETERYIHGIDVVISIVQSGNGPESVAVSERIHQIRPKIAQWEISCSPEESVVHSPFVHSIILDPGSADRDLAIANSFSCLVLAGIFLIDPTGVRSAVQKARVEVRAKLDAIDQAMRTVAQMARHRIVLLASSPLFSWAQMGAEKITETTAGKFPAIAETYLRLRHGSMSFLEPDTMYFCLLSSEPSRRRYERNLIRELRARHLGYWVGISATAERTELFDATIPAILPANDDVSRAPFEIIAPQLLGYHLSLRAKLDPDS